MSENYDVIVVGAGPGGITCGALLAKSGLKTIVLEKNNRVGGKTVGSPVRGFKGEMWPISGMPMTRGPFKEAFSQLGIETEFKVIAKSSAMMYRRRGGEWTATVNIPEAETSPDPTAIFDQWGLDAKQREAALRVFTEVALLTEEQLSALDDVSVEEFLTRYEDLPGPLHSHFALMTNGLITSVPELVAMSELVRVQRSLSLPGPSGYPEGGYQRMFDNIAAAFKANGGEVQTRSKVERIIVEDSRVTGVATSDRIFKATIVISNAGIHPTVFKLVGEEHFDKSYVGYVRDLLPSLGFTSIRYILNRPVLPHALYWVTSEDSWLNLERLNKISAGEVPEEVSIYMTIPSNYDPGMAPPGKQMIVFGTWCSPNPEDREIKMLQRRTEELLAEVFPEIVPAIESKAGYTGPAQVSALTRDHVLPGQGGEAVGLAVTIGQCGKNKPSAKTPLPGLFYVGHDAGGSALMGTHQAMDSGIKVARLARLYHLERKQAVL